MRIAVLSKETLFCESLASLLDRHGNYQVVARESNARNLINQAKQQHAQLLVVDTHQLDKDDLQFLLGARAFGDFVIVLIAKDEEKELYADSAVDRLVTRSSSAEALFGALADLGANVKVARPYVREGRRGYRDGSALTRREYEVANLVAKGLSNRRISQVSGLREQSVKNLVSVIMRKLRCENRTQVALKLLNAEVVEPEGGE